MTAMGIGAGITRWLHNDLPEKFVYLQLFVALLGGFSATILYFSFAFLDNFEAFLYLVVIGTGIGLGAEVPLILRILQSQTQLRENLADVLSADYIGALFASLLFPLILVPQLGLMQTGYVMGLCNVIVAFVAWYAFKEDIHKPVKSLMACVLAILLLFIGFQYTSTFMQAVESRLYDGEIIASEQTPYQKLLINRQGDHVSFFINGALQFDSRDEYRYHESLVHPAMNIATHHHNILVLGGGDGLALREVLRYPQVTSVDLVDLDPAVTALFSRNSLLKQLNKESLQDSRLTIYNQDAKKFLEKTTLQYDIIIIDLPDPNNFSLSGLYAEGFYRLVQSRLSLGGVMVTQATSPLFSREAFWCIKETILMASDHAFNVIPYHTYIPSFGEWGFVLATKLKRRQWDNALPSELVYFTENQWDSMQIFPEDMRSNQINVNRITDHKLVRLYDEGYAEWFSK